MTKEDVLSTILLYVKHSASNDLYKDLIDQIFNDHEAQLKLASDVYSTDKMHMYQELKAKDEEIERLKESYAAITNNFECAIREIDRLKEQKHNG